MGLHGFLAMALPLSNHPCANQGSHAGIDMNDRAAGKIQRAALEKPTAVRPYHVGDRQVGEGHPNDREDNHRPIADPLSETPDYERARNACKRGLECRKAQFGDGASHLKYFIRQVVHANEREMIEASKYRVSFCEGERVAINEP